MKLDFCSLSSGSSGNCYYLGNEFHGILIDAGIQSVPVLFVEKRFLLFADAVAWVNAL